MSIHYDGMKDGSGKEDGGGGVVGWIKKNACGGWANFKLSIWSEIRVL